MRARRTRVLRVCTSALASPKRLPLSTPRRRRTHLPALLGRGSSIRARPLASLRIRPPDREVGGEDEARILGSLLLGPTILAHGQKGQLLGVFPNRKIAVQAIIEKETLEQVPLLGRSEGEVVRIGLL